MSLPTRERGLKFELRNVYIFYYIVAPYAGAWIEINFFRSELPQHQVAPYAGAWIEISM